MAKGVNQKQKMLYLAKIFLEETDEEHGLTLAEISEKLGAYGVTGDRKTLYQDFEELRRFGLDILASKEGIATSYRLVSRTFELPELKLLVDSVPVLQIHHREKVRGADSQAGIPGQRL